MKKGVIGIGGIFFKSKDPDKIKEWYAKHLGFNVNPWGVTFEIKSGDIGENFQTVWNPFKDTTKYFEPSTKEFMVNLMVADLAGMYEDLKKSDVEMVDELQDTEYGKFLHIMDPEGNKLELWEPK